MSKRTIRVLVDDDVFAALKALADECNMPLATFVRRGLHRVVRADTKSWDEPLDPTNRS